MKKIGLLCVTALVGLSLTACGNNSSNKASSSSKTSSSKVVKHHKKAKKDDKKQRVPSSSSSSANVNGQQTQGQQGKSQSEINRERGYDPNGNPLLPGQDHAAGSNPDGSPDAWVQWQIDWEKQNGYLNPDGTETQKGIEADQEVERNSQPGMP